MASKKHINIILAVALTLGLAAPSAKAQYDQDISVEGRYVPEFIPHDRIGLFPKAVKFPLEKSSLAYASEGVDADFTPQAIPIPVTGWNDSRKFAANRGYLDFGLGSWLESTLSAGYRFVDNAQTAFGIRLQHNSCTLWHPKLSEETRGTYMRRYDEALGLYGSHSFGDLGRLDAAVDYHLGYFNYYGYDPSPLPALMSAPDQTLNDVSARVQWMSPSRIDDVAWNAGVGIRYFGMRSLYVPTLFAPAYETLRGGRETDADLTAGVSFPISGKSLVGIDMESHVLAYRSTEYTVPETYGTMALTPYYRFTRSRLDIRIGARVDLAFNAGSPEKRYRTFNIAPSIKLDYNAGAVALFLHVLGGNRLHTLASLYGQDYYAMPALLSSTPAYSPLDAKLGATFGPFSGFSAGFDIACRLSRDEDLLGWYTAMLSGPGAAFRLGLPDDIGGRPVVWFGEAEQRADFGGYSLGLSLAYDAGRYFKVETRGSYQQQQGKTGYYNGMDRPRWVLTGAVTSNPWDTLKMSLACDYRAVRRFPIRAWFDDGAEPAGELYMYRVKDYFSLNFSASYRFSEVFGVWVEADDLTNRRNVLAPGLPEAPVRLAAGLDFTF